MTQMLQGVYYSGETAEEVCDKNGTFLALSELVTEGLLEMGVDSNGDTVWWKTELGYKVIG